MSFTPEMEQEAVRIIRDLVEQITAFAEQHGEADFYTGSATAFLLMVEVETTNQRKV
jgi:hypothetical protein